ncbi:MULTISPECIES: hypothetical protein [Cyanophyceae]|uniref:hypothetical protein n=1 Tax=Cyanophyceae TaxID=3028117 RepID=UPI001682EE27|nr:MULTISPECIES: hypothetical protein [Cyanophyceae]MBD1914430.1 hypothetical protein [Phormidium sp. FACHB-77]MBD2028873.1 hypothetical protein [Phormidium sp. FACHB-322]MBD2049223.1 hypothetical protein [Leptolyngbya sp. FACHB-60]
MIIKTGTSNIHSPSTVRTEDRPFSDADLVCFSPLRWEMLSQRSQHILGDRTQKQRVFFIEAPVVEFIDSWWIDVNQNEWGVWVVVPHVLDWVNDELREAMRQSLMNELFEQFAIATPTLRYSTPAASPSTHYSKFSALHN